MCTVEDVRESMRILNSNWCDRLLSACSISLKLMTMVMMVMMMVTTIDSTNLLLIQRLSVVWTDEDLTRDVTHFFGDNVSTIQRDSTDNFHSFGISIDIGLYSHFSLFVLVLCSTLTMLSLMLHRSSRINCSTSSRWVKVLPFASLRWQQNNFFAGWFFT